MKKTICFLVALAMLSALFGCSLSSPSDTAAVNASTEPTAVTSADPATEPGETSAPKTTSPETTTPETVPVTAPDGSLVVMLSRPDAGTVEVEKASGEVTVRALPNEGFRAIAFSDGALLANGGDLLAIGDELTLPDDGGSRTVYLTFAEAHEHLLYYDLRGGKTADGADRYLDVYSSDFFLCPNTVPDTGIFTRAGYTLLEYNTEPDGSGLAVNPGGKLAPSESGIDLLYAVWSEWTPASDFETEAVEGGLAIKSWGGNADVLSIPAEIGGKPVVAVRAGAVTGKRFSTLVIPSSVTTVEDGAFTECLHFETLYLCDTVTSISDAAFSGCRAYKTLCYNAASDPVYGNNFFGACCIKYERLLTLPKDDGVRTVVTLGGSSMVYGLNSPYMEELLGEGFRVLNYGTNQGSCGLFYAEVASHYLQAGDILIHAPEYSGVQCGLAFSWKTVRETEYCYNIFRDVDISRYSGVLSSIAECNRNRRTITPGSYLDQSGQLNLWGDGIDNLEHRNFAISPNTTVKASTLTTERARAFHATYALLDKVGVTVFFSFPPFVRGALKSDSDLAGYAAAVETGVPVRVISDPADYLFEVADTYEYAYHLNVGGARKRTEKLAADLLAALAAPSGE